MSARSRYTARLVPADLEPRDVLVREGAVVEAFTPFTFAAQRADPTGIEVTWRHDGGVHQVGYLVTLSRGSWWTCKFELDDTLLGCFARDTLEIGSPVSIEFVPLLVRSIDNMIPSVRYDAARLVAVAVGITTPAYAGAEITAITPNARPRSQPHRDPPQLLAHRAGGHILGLR